MLKCPTNFSLLPLCHGNRQTEVIKPQLFKEKPNARIWAIIGSITACLSFPLGTAVGVYGLWFLFGEQGKQFYENAGNPNYLNSANSVNDFQFNDVRERQPHSWK